MGWRDRAQPVSSSWRDKAEPVSPVPGIAKSVVDSATLDADGNYVAKTSDGQTLRFTPQGQRILDAGEALDAMRGPGATFTEGALERGLSALHGASNSLTGKMAGGIARLRGEDPAAAEKNAMATVNPAVDAHPGYNIAGAVAPALLAPTSAAGAAGKAVPFATRALKAGAQALPSSFLNAYGHTTPDQSAGEQALQTAVGGTASTVAGGVLGGAMAKGGEKFANWLKDRASVNALKATGLRPGINAKLKQLGIMTTDDALEMGSKLRDSGLIPAWSTPADVERILQDVLETEGPKQAQILAEIDRVTRQGGKFFSPTEAARKVEESIAPKFGTNGIRQEAAAGVQKNIEHIRDLPGGAGQAPSEQGFQEFNQFLQDWGGNVNWKAPELGQSGELPVKLERQAWGAARRHLVDKAADTASPELAQALDQTKGRLSLAKDALKLASDDELRNLAKRSDYVGKALSGLWTAGGAATMAGGSPVAGAALFGLGAANAALQPRLPALAMSMQKTAAPVASAAGDALAPYMGVASAKETSDAFADLSAYLGRPPKNKEEGADTHFTAGQSDQQWQRKNSPQ